MSGRNFGKVLLLSKECSEKILDGESFTLPKNLAFQVKEILMSKGIVISLTPSKDDTLILKLKK